MKTSATEEGVPLFWLAAVVLRERRLIARVTAAGLLITLAVALLRPATYTSSFTFLPQAASEQGQAALASLAGQFGISLGAAGGAEQSPQFYADLITTRRVLGPIAADSVSPDADSAVQVPLSEFLRIKQQAPAVRLDKTLRELREEVISTSVAKRTTSVATVSVKTRSPYVSLEIARRLITGLSEYNLVTRQSQAREERLFTEGRLEVAKASLRAAEDALQRFLQANQKGESPALTFQRERLQREVSLQERVVTTLAQQYEENRIREVRDTPVITVIEVPVLAARADSRHRVRLLLLGGVASFGVAVLVAVLARMWRREGEGDPDPALASLKEEWRRMRGAPAP